MLNDVIVKYLYIFDQTTYAINNYDEHSIMNLNHQTT